MEDIIFHYENFLEEVKEIAQVQQLISDFLASIELMEFDTNEKRISNGIYIEQEKNKFSSLAFLIKKNLNNLIMKNEKIINTASELD